MDNVLTTAQHDYNGAYQNCVPKPYQDNWRISNINPIRTQFFNPIVFFRQVRTIVWKRQINLTCCRRIKTWLTCSTKRFKKLRNNNVMVIIDIKIIVIHIHFIVNVNLITTNVNIILIVNIIIILSSSFSSSSLSSSSFPSSVHHLHLRRHHHHPHPHHRRHQHHRHHPPLL